MEAPLVLARWPWGYCDYPPRRILRARWALLLQALRSAGEAHMTVRSTHETSAPSIPLDEIPEPSLDLLKRVAQRLRTNGADDTAPLVEWAVEQIEEHERSFDLRWNADMRAIKRWQAAAPGRELTWPDHADLCVWLLEQSDRSAVETPTHAGWCALINPDPCNCSAVKAGTAVETNVCPHPGCNLPYMVKHHVHATSSAERAAKVWERQCSWGCHYVGDQFIRYAACTVHGASSEKATDGPYIQDDGRDN